MYHYLTKGSESDSSSESESIESCLSDTTNVEYITRIDNRIQQTFDIDGLGDRMARNLTIWDDEEEEEFKTQNDIEEGAGEEKDDIEEGIDEEEVDVTLFDRETLQSKRVTELQEILKSLKKKHTGRKHQLIERILGLDGEEDDVLERNTIGRLKDKLKALNKSTKGSKKELIERLRGEEEFVEGSFDDYNNRYSRNELLEKLKSLKKDTGGNRDDLINRLIGNEQPMPKEEWKTSKINRAKAREERYHGHTKEFNVLRHRFRHGNTSADLKLSKHKTCVDVIHILMHFELINRPLMSFP